MILENNDVITIPQSQMTVSEVSGNYDVAKFPPEHVLDGDIQTCWTSVESKTDSNYIVFDLGGRYTVTKIRLLPHLFNVDDSIYEYNIYTSNDGINFKLVTTGEWESTDKNRVEQEAFINNEKTGYIKFETVRTYRKFLCFAEFNVEGIPISPNHSISIDSPTTREIIQREQYNKTVVQINGQYSTEEDIQEFEVRATLMEDALAGQAIDWTPITDLENGNFTAKLLMEAGGWYQIEARMKLLDQYHTTQVEKVGIGDLYLTTGQSNSANFGNTPTTPVHDTVSAWNPNTSTWEFAQDPQVSVTESFTGEGGSPWPTLGDYLVERFQIPIGFITMGWGSTSVEKFMPGNEHYSRIQLPLIHFGKQGIKAVLWHQGESDAINETSAEVYSQRLLAIIQQSRIDAGWNVPWVIATASYIVGHASTESEEAIVMGQKAVCNETDIFLGPNTNDMRDDYRGGENNPAHMSHKGLVEHGLRWGNVLSHKLYGEDQVLCIGKTTITETEEAVLIEINSSNPSPEERSVNLIYSLYEELTDYPDHLIDTWFEKEIQIPPYYNHQSKITIPKAGVLEGAYYLDIHLQTRTMDFPKLVRIK